jgi:hypothetical protein
MFFKEYELLRGSVSLDTECEIFISIEDCTKKYRKGLSTQELKTIPAGSSGRYLE